MAISYVGGASNGNTTVTLPTHQEGDLIIIFAYRNAATAPTLPTGYTSISTQSGNANSFRIGYKFAGSNAETSGTWTNANITQVAIYRGAAGVGGAGSTTSAASTTTTISGITTMTVTNGTSWVLRFAGSKQTTSMSTPSSTTLRTTGTGTTSFAIMSDSNGGVITAAATSSTNASSVTNSGGSVEILAGTSSTGNSVNSPTLVGSSSVAGKSITIPTHQAGDLILLHAYRDGNNTPPTNPGGWTSLGFVGANTNSAYTVYKVAASGSETSGTWTNATHLIVHVYRNANFATPAFAGTSNTGSGTKVTYGTWNRRNSLSTSTRLVAFAGHRSVDTALQTPPAGYSITQTLVNATSEVASFDLANVNGSIVTQSIPIGGTSSGWETMMVEISGYDFSDYTDAIPATWTPPEDGTVDVYAWGAGGGSGGTVDSGGGSGGGGGAFSKGTGVSVTGSTGYTVQVGSGGTAGAATSGASAGNGQDSYFGTSSTVMAKGGGGGLSSTSFGAQTTVGVGGSASSSVGSTKNDGGNGGQGNTNGGGGGGGSGGATGAGGTGGNGGVGVGGTGGAAGAGSGGTSPAGYAGAAGTNTPNGQNATTLIGGGAGASGAGTGTGGTGGTGRVMILFTPTANLPPTTALGTTDNTTFNTSTPTFYATGTDPEGDDVVYQLSFQNRWGYYQNPVSSNGITGTNAGQKRAVSFSPTITHKAKYIYNSLRVTGAPTDDLKLEIFSNGSSEPGSLLATASNTVSGTLLTTSQSIQRYDFSEPLTLSSGTTYWAVWSRTGSLDDANYFGVGGSTSASPDGQLARAWNGSAWTTTGLLYTYLQVSEAPVPRADGAAYIRLDSDGSIPSSYPSGSQVRIEFVTPFPAGQYQWTVRAGDPSPGSGTYGNWATTRYYVIATDITNGSSANLMF